MVVTCDMGLVADGIKDGIKKSLNEKITDLLKDPTALTAKIRPFLTATGLNEILKPIQVGNSAIAVTGNYRRTCVPLGCQGGDVLMWADGIDIGADLAVDGAGAAGPFPRSAAVNAEPLEGVIHGRQRPDGSEFDLAAYVNGSTVNQVLRALADGGAGGPGIFDLGAAVGAWGVGVHPGVAPMFKTSGVPQVDGDLKFFAPQLRVNISPTSNLYRYATAVADVRVGANVQLDPDTMTLDPSVDANVSIRSLQLDRAAGINWTNIDVTNLPLPPDVKNWLEHDLPTSLANGALSPIQLPQLAPLLEGAGILPLDLGRVDIGSKDGYLGIWVDVDPHPVAPFTLRPIFGNGRFNPPTSVQFSVAPAGFPGSGPYAANWTITDHVAPGDPVIYQTPQGDGPLTVTLDGNQIAFTGDVPHEAQLEVNVTVSRGGKTASYSGMHTISWEPHP